MRAFSLDFRFDGGIGVPCDPHLHQLAAAYAEKHLNAPINFTDYRKVLVACAVDEQGVPIAVHGLQCWVFKPDAPVTRFTHEDAAEVLFERSRAWLEDNNYRGGEAFIFIADHEDARSRCPDWRGWLQKMRLAKAQRWRVTI